ncbi:uncharacterized protein EI90DRAFT_3041235 [Cantharellus anzutake]|uniref:uncharacterized protein n=1 Tax=Cantharellus anzutake TaxID=1750568 RepID=UPI00190612C4|nr:uncharacterized protein EI90DRAFT_3041235 [Cantharellus anzutake]KAF8337984.1 hypothetical protein EI90DRAFT_3041235 [Cantharellus anzutake]
MTSPPPYVGARPRLSLQAERLRDQLEDVRSNSLPLLFSLWFPYPSAFHCCRWVSMLLRIHAFKIL